LISQPVFLVAESVDGFDSFNFFNSDIFDLWHVLPKIQQLTVVRIWCESCPCHSLLRVRAPKLLEAIIVRSLLVYLLHFMVFLSLAGRNGIERRYSRR
jgi:hypothetical protein